MTSAANAEHILNVELLLLAGVWTVALLYMQYRAWQYKQHIKKLLLDLNRAGHHGQHEYDECFTCYIYMTYKIGMKL